MAVHEGLFSDGDPPRLLGSRCDACGQHHFPRAETCPYCAAPGAHPVELSDTGRLWAWTAVTAAPPGYQGEVPYGFGVVELPEGLRVLGRLTEADPSRLAADQPMRLVIVALHDDEEGRAVVTYAFSPDPPPAWRRPPVTSVEVAGIGLHPFGRFPDTSITEMGVQAVRAALAEAEAGRGDFQAAFCGTAYGGVASGHKVLGALGLTGMPIVDVEAGLRQRGRRPDAGGGGHPGRAVRHGRWCSASRRCPRASSARRSSTPGRRRPAWLATPAYFALRAQRLMLSSGVTKDHLAAVVVKNRRHGVPQPRRHVPFRGRRRRGARLAGGLRAAAPVDALHAQRGCRRRGAHAPATAAGAGSGWPAAVLRSHLPGPVLSESTPHGRHRPTTRCRAPARWPPPPPTRRPVSAPRDLDVVECQDTDAARELLAYEELGLCEPGGAGALLDQGATALGGRLPVNPSGGLLSKGEPLGASGLGQVVELVRQLRGDAGPRQVEGARVALAHTIGRGANAGVTILTR